MTELETIDFQETDLIPIIDPKLTLPKSWNYIKSVEKCKIHAKKGSEEFQSLLKEFQIAHEILTKDSKKKHDRKYPGKTFETFCQDFGTTKMTAYRWFHKYIPRYLPELPEKVTNVTIPQIKKAISKIENEVESIIEKANDSDLEKKLEISKLFRQINIPINDFESQVLKEEYGALPEEPKELPDIHVYIFQEISKLARKLDNRMEEVLKNVDSVNFNNLTMSLFGVKLEQLKEKIDKFLEIFDEKREKKEIDAIDIQVSTVQEMGEQLPKFEKPKSKKKPLLLE